MRTWTIYLACSEAEKVWNPYRNENFDTYPAKRVARAERQTLKFSAELERRMDERDAVIPAARHAADAHFDWVVSEDQRERQAMMDWDDAMMEIHSAFVSQARHK